MQTAACYIRVSTDDQLEYSPDSQLKLIQEYAEKNDILLLENYIFIEDDGKSGKSIEKRDRFLDMLAVAKKKPCPFDLILVWKFSRFARNQEQAITIKSMLKKNNVEVISISEPLPEGPFGELIERILEWQDEYYLTNLSQEVKRGMAEKASRGEPITPPPIGYSMEKGMYVPNADADLVRGIFNDYINGMGLRAIAVKYTALGMRSKRGNPLDNRGIEYILRNPTYIGKIRWSTDGRAASTRHYDSPNIVITDGKHQPIINPDVFVAVGQRLDAQKRMYGKYQRPEQKCEYMLKGLVRCGDCNSTLVYISTKAPSLQCHKYARGQCAVSHNIKLETANAAVIKFIKDAFASDTYSFVKRKKTAENGLEVDYEKLIANETAKLARVREAYEKGVDSLEEYRYNKQRIQSSIEKLRKLESKANAETAPPTAAELQEFRRRLLDVIRTVTDPAQTELAKGIALRTVIEHITFHRPENSFEVYFYI